MAIEHDEAMRNEELLAVLDSIDQVTPESVATLLEELDRRRKGLVALQKIVGKPALDATPKRRRRSKKDVAGGELPGGAASVEVAP